ncbi:efflux RND transporter periplasmic adaptor subunit [Desulfohalobiaceae bacterium Ax17]|uniref:efflux RND transporter periplasmic adaptor subunit n=1 Tax=Desulfovulcanus ferrireducens TaxID=2831190 RepID=UPI00207B9A93|nr:efflux RND transporter periplasmic adaptor subunit [Desulfovulcanus ferrireducens]MBT8763217.1 efflux RND transporter periplasmic adaptor subunit [Desulfovulcanus ferrireducens]
MIKKTLAILVTLTLIAGAILLVKHRKAQLSQLPLPQQPLLAVEVAPVYQGSLAVKERYLGTIESKLSANIAPRVTGHLVEVRGREGDKVQKGDLLALLDDRSQRNRIVGLEAELEAARAALVTQTNVYARDKQLFEAKALSQEALDRSKDAKIAARARVINLERALDTARIELSYTRLTAPFDGMITARLQEPGDLALPGKPILSMEAPEAGYTVEVKVSQDVFPKLRVGGEALIFGPTENTPIKAAISRLHPAIQSEEGKSAVLPTVEIDLKKRPFSLSTGSTVEVELITSKVHGWIVPTRALLETTDASYLFLVSAENTIRVLPVTVLARGPEKACVDGDIPADARVVVAGESGLLRLHPGQKVHPVAR